MEKRFKEHCKACTKPEVSNRPLYRAMKKYGVDKFYVNVVEECPENILDDREQYWVDFYKSYGKHGYNATIGGDGKPYINRMLILKLWNSGLSVKEISIKANCCIDSVTNILRDKIDNYTETAFERGLSNLKHAVAAYNPKTGELLDTYPSCQAAYTAITGNTGLYKGHIAEVIAGTRKTYLKRVWKPV